MESVAPLRHVGDRPALEVPVIQPWDLRQESEPKADFQPTARAGRGCRPARIRPPAARRRRRRPHRRPGAAARPGPGRDRCRPRPGAEAPRRRRRPAASTSPTARAANESGTAAEKPEAGPGRDDSAARPAPRPAPGRAPPDRATRCAPGADPAAHPDEDGPPKQYLVPAVGVRRAGAGRPVAIGDVPGPAGVEERGESPPGLAPLPQSAGADQRRDEPRRRVQPRQGMPAGLVATAVDQGLSGPADPQVVEAAGQRTEELAGDRPVAPGLGRDRQGVDVDLVQEPVRRDPAPSHGRVHHLDHRPVTPPDQHEVRQAIRQTDDGDGRQRSGLIQQQVIGAGPSPARPRGRAGPRPPRATSIDVPSTSVWHASRSRP